jgi:hypothetical protein
VVVMPAQTLEICFCPPGIGHRVRRTPCRSAANAPHERFADVTPMSLRRGRPLQRLVRRRGARWSARLASARLRLRTGNSRMVQFKAWEIP